MRRISSDCCQQPPHTDPRRRRRRRVNVGRVLVINDPPVWYARWSPVNPPSLSPRSANHFRVAEVEFESRT